MAALLRRYTSLSLLLDVLENKKITLVDPQKWDDRNDAEFLRIYQEEANIGSLLALCFSEVADTYHHWKIYGSGLEGVCIAFRRKKLEKILTRDSCLEFGKVKYKTLTYFREGGGSLEKMPFYKRDGYQAEEEWRLIAKLATPNELLYPIAITPDCIEKVVLSPWMPASLHKTTKVLLRKIDGFQRLRVSRSRLISSIGWGEAGARLARRSKKGKTAQR
jgi:hypothetical protein